MSTAPRRKSELRAAAIASSGSIRIATLARAAAPFAFIAALIACVWWFGLETRQLGHFGDDQEYLTMTMSFARHGSPEFREGDDRAMLDELPRRWQRSMVRKFEAGRAPGAYFESKTGHWYAFHFFTYSAVVAPLRAWMIGSPDASRAHQFMNLFLLSCALASLALLRSQPRLFWVLTPLVFFTPVFWFTPYASTETFVYAMGICGLACLLSDRPILAIAFNSIAATQYQPLALLSLFLCAHTLWSVRSRWRSELPRVAAAVAATALVFVPSIFYYVHFGTPNLIAREGFAATRFMEFRKFAGLFIDLNGGMLIYVPGLLLLSTVAAVSAVARLRQRDVWGVGFFACVLLSMAASTVQRNWNHPTFGISRYVVYALAPCLMFIGGELRLRALNVRWAVGLCALALALQAWVHEANGWFEYRANDSAHQSEAALFVLDRWPWLYSPHPEIFCERIAKRCWPDPETGEPNAESLPVVWRNSRDAVRKILATRCDEAKVLAAEEWTPYQRERIQAAMARCSGKGTLYIDM